MHTQPLAPARAATRIASLLVLMLALTAAGRTALAHAIADIEPAHRRTFGKQLLAKVRVAADHA